MIPSCNPFNSSVTIACEGDPIPGQLMVYDITGRLIRSLSDREGSSFTWDGLDASGADVPTGTYLIQGAVDGQVSSVRVVRL
jgi:flagellar hook assembly protein FlgD